MFIKYFYQPFFNTLVGIYWALGQMNIEWADMGIAVIIFAIVVRIITFPLTLASERSDDEKREIVKKIEAIKQHFSHDPIGEKREMRKVMAANRRIVFSTTANLIIQALIIIMLYRIFTTGLEGKDFYLLYDFMPKLSHVNLLFLGKYDLTHTNSTLNLIQSAMIFVVELLVALRSPFRISRKDIAVTQFFLPIGSYLIFIYLPAGKKLFIITSLVFSSLYHSYRLIQTWSRVILKKLAPPTQEEAEEVSPPPTHNTPPTENPPQNKLE